MYPVFGGINSVALFRKNSMFSGTCMDPERVGGQASTGRPQPHRSGAAARCSQGSGPVLRGAKRAAQGRGAIGSGIRGLCRLCATAHTGSHAADGVTGAHANPLRRGKEAPTTAVATRGGSPPLDSPGGPPLLSGRSVALSASGTARLRSLRSAPARVRACGAIQGLKGSRVKGSPTWPGGAPGRSCRGCRGRP